MIIKMIKIKNKDSIIDIIKKIESCKDEKIVLEFPIGNSVLHNYTSLKLLKNKAKNKELIIITNDINAKKIWKRLWIKYSLLNNNNAIKNIDLLKYNYTFSEYFVFLIKSYLNEIKNFFSRNNISDSILFKNKKKKEKTRIWFFLLWLWLSIFLLFFIFYFAVNETYITIKPEITIKTKAKNFIFEENYEETISDDNIIKILPISTNISLEDIFWTSWVKQEWNIQSKWKVTLYNHLAENIDLIDNSRLQTGSWILYTIDWSVTIPKAIKSSSWSIIPWKINVNISSKYFDSQWKFAWEKANIWTWVYMFFPWLKDLSNSIYAESISNLTWATNNYIKIVWEEDLDNAKLLFEEKLKKEALNELKNKIKEKNQNNNITYEILWIDDMIKYSNLEIKNVDNIKIWEERKNFTLTWSIQIDTYIFNKESVINKLKITINDSLLEDVENINYINENSLRLSNIIYQYSNPFEAKITTEIEVFYSLNFKSDTNQYLDKLRDKITWLEINEAKTILLNNSKISDVKIETRPFFMKTISNIKKNILFEVDE